jgi:hypothetical protein
MFAVCLMVLNATFNNISVIISWRSVLLVEETGVPGKTTDLSQVIDNLYRLDDDEEKSVVITPESFYLNFIPSCLLTFNMSIYRQSVPKTF